jgi:hypothetical protein
MKALQGEAIGDICRRGQHRVHQLRTTIDSDVRFYAEVLLFAFRGLMHLGVTFIVASTIVPVVILMPLRRR